MPDRASGRRKKWVGPVTLLIVGVLIGLLGKYLLLSFKETEKSYKGGVESRYLKEFRKVPYTLPADNSSLVPGARAKATTIMQQFERA